MFAKSVKAEVSRVSCSGAKDRSLDKCATKSL